MPKRKKHKNDKDRSNERTIAIRPQDHKRLRRWAVANKRTNKAQFEVILDGWEAMQDA